MINSVKIQFFFKISDDETDFIVGITSNFIEFQDNRNFTFFEAGVEWFTLSHVSSCEQVKQ